MFNLSLHFISLLGQEPLMCYPFSKASIQQYGEITLIIVIYWVIFLFIVVFLMLIPGQILSLFLLL